TGKSNEGAVAQCDKQNFLLANVPSLTAHCSGAEKSARSIRYPTSPHVHQREGEFPPTAARHRLVDPKHGERLQQACVLQRAGITWRETELTDELHHRWLPLGIALAIK